MRKKYLLVSLVIICLLHSFSIPIRATPADFAIDQECDSNMANVVYLYNTSYLWQNFTASINNINQVEVYLGNWVGTVTESVNATVLINDTPDNNTPLAYSIITGLENLEGFSYQWYNCSFDMVTLIPGNSYYILINTTYSGDGWFGWLSSMSNQYSGGQASINSNWDFGFRTYYDTDEAVLPEFQNNLIPILIPSILITFFYRKNK